MPTPPARSRYAIIRAGSSCVAVVAVLVALAASAQAVAGASEAVFPPEMSATTADVPSSTVEDYALLLAGPRELFGPPTPTAILADHVVQQAPESFSIWTPDPRPVNSTQEWLPEVITPFPTPAAPVSDRISVPLNPCGQASTPIPWPSPSLSARPPQSLASRSGLATVDHSLAPTAERGPAINPADKPTADPPTPTPTPTVTVADRDPSVPLPLPTVSLYPQRTVPPAAVTVFPAEAAPNERPRVLVAPHPCVSTAPPSLSDSPVAQPSAPETTTPTLDASVTTTPDAVVIPTPSPTPQASSVPSTSLSLDAMTPAPTSPAANSAPVPSTAASDEETYSDADIVRAQARQEHVESVLFDSAMQDALAGAEGQVSVAVINLASGKSAHYQREHAYVSASIVKLLVLATALYQDQSKGGLTPEHQAWAEPMITLSANEATTSLFDDLGGQAALQTMAETLGMTATDVSDNWGLTTTTVDDQIQLLRAFAQPNDVLNAHSQEIAQELMSAIAGDQRWGVGAVGSTPLLKNGWLPLEDDDNKWELNSVGLVNLPNGDRAAIAILSRGWDSYPADTSWLDAVAEVAAHAVS